MPLVITLLICLAITLLGAQAPKPIGWIALGFAVLAMLFAILGGVGFHVGR